jgi:hypothetical protein
MDINNKLILSKSGNDKLSLDLQNLPRGIYLIKIIVDNFYVTKKVIKI